MKRTVIAIVLLGLVCLLCFACSRFTEKNAEGILVALDELEEAYAKEDITRCLEITESMIEHFDTIETVYLYFGHHDIMHELSESLKKIPIWMQHGDDSAFYTEVMTCRLMCEEMYCTQQPLPENIF